MIPPSPRVSAGLVALTCTQAGVHVLLGRRAPTMKSFAGAFVFPGGLQDAADQDPAWRAVDAEDCPADCVALKVTAVRECFEETGFLAVDTREPLCAGGGATDGFRVGRVARRGLAALVPIARFVTPRAEERRYDTVFFARVFEPEVMRLKPLTHDKGETVSAGWYLASQVLADKKQFPLMPPQWLVIQRLAQVLSAPRPSALAPASWPLVAAEPAMLPSSAAADSGPRILSLPGDELHPYMPGPEGAHHRLLLGGFNGKLLHPAVTYTTDINSLVPRHYLICPEPAATG